MSVIGIQKERCGRHEKYLNNGQSFYKFDENDEPTPQAIPLHPRVQILQAAQGLGLLRGPHSSRNLHFQMRAVLPEPLLI